MGAPADFDGATYEPDLDRERLSSLLERVHARMLDGRWHTLAELVAACGGTEASVSARLRDLRKPKFGSHDIERLRDPDADGLFRYRMTSSLPIAEIIEATPLGWRFHATERYALVSIPEGFTVCRVMVPVAGKPTPMYEAWDARTQPARRLGMFPWQDQAKACAAAEYAKDANP